MSNNTNRNKGMYNQKREDYTRPEDDFFETPEVATYSLLAHLSIPENVTLWEPCCGWGAISKVLKTATPNKVLSTELVTDRYGVGGVNFFEADEHKPREPFWIITNPPYNIAADIIRKAIDLGPQRIIMLLRLGFLESGKVREDILNNGHLFRVLMIKERLKMYPYGYQGDTNQTGKYTHAWFIWDKYYNSPVPTEVVVRRISQKDGIAYKETLRKD